ncbi:RsiV family protein [Mycobacterium sp. UM_WWY]
MFSGGRILVAAVGAIVLIVVAVYAVRSVWWDPASKTTSLSQLPSASTTVSTAATTAMSTADASGGTGGTPGGGGGGDGSYAGASATSSTTTTTTTTSSATATPFTAKADKVSAFLGTTYANVSLPQVDGGDPAVAGVFNDEMRKVLQSQADSLTGGRLEDRPGSGVRIGQRVLSGLLRTAAVDTAKATSRPLVGTVVVDAQSGSVITLSSLFNDLNAGLKLLVQESKKLGPSSAAGANFDGTKLQATEQTFNHWTAEAAGLHVFFDQGTVAPSSSGIVDITIPWSDLNSVMKSGVQQIVSS